jgi:hypothetical protein
MHLYIKVLFYRESLDFRPKSHDVRRKVTLSFLTIIGLCIGTLWVFTHNMFNNLIVIFPGSVNCLSYYFEVGVSTDMGWTTERIENESRCN